MMLSNFVTAGGFRYMANSQAEADRIHAGAQRSPINAQGGVPFIHPPAERPGASNAAPNLNAEAIFARRLQSVNAQRSHGTLPKDEPIDGESIFARRARQVRAQRAGAASTAEGGAGARVFSDEYAANVFASRSRGRAVAE